MGEPGTHKKHIEFLEVNHMNPKGKTCVWFVYSLDRIQLGIIKWKSQWRQYCFFPESDTLYNAGCLNDIADFMKENRGRRQ